MGGDGAALTSASGFLRRGIGSLDFHSRTFPCPFTIQNLMWVVSPAFAFRAHASWFEERLPDALVQSASAVHTPRVPIERLVGGLALLGVGALLATIWSDGGVVVEDVAVAVTPTGGVLASRSFGW